MSQLISDIIKKLFYGDARLVIVTNRDGFVWSHRREIESEYGKPVRIFAGKSLDLRLVYEIDMREDANSRFLFVADDDIEILEDIEQQADYITFNTQQLFRRYHWATIRHLSLDELEWLYNQKQKVNLDQIATHNLVCEYQKSPNFRKKAIADLKKHWQQLTARINFRKPKDFMPELARIMLQAIQLNAWDKFGDEVLALNEQFQKFLSDSYNVIINASLGTSQPRNVTQVTPYIAKQNDEKSALIVIDGMNFWQATLLCNALEDILHNVVFDVSALYSWLPSVTELSRQAIFLGGRPDINYPQSPAAESKLWLNFWKDKKMPEAHVCYQHSGQITHRFSSKRIGYVNTDLDEKMHSAENYMYLYDDTLRWIKEGVLISDIEKLLSEGFRVYITSDHGNIETLPYRPLSPSDKVGAQCDRRYITLAPQASEELFKNAYAGHISQIDDSRTFYAIDREIFSTEQGVVTHGGTHFLEVLIPFITITSKE